MQRYYYITYIAWLELKPKSKMERDDSKRFVFITRGHTQIFTDVKTRRSVKIREPFTVFSPLCPLCLKLYRIANSVSGSKK